MTKKKRIVTTASRKKSLWRIFTKYIKKRDRNTCFTCGKVAYGQGMCGGHFIPAAVCPPSLYFHEDNVHAQCSYCNLMLEGNHYEYGLRLGFKTVKKLRELKKIKTGEKWTIEEYQNMIKHYKDKYNELCSHGI